MAIFEHSIKGFLTVLTLHIAVGSAAAQPFSIERIGDGAITMNSQSIVLGGTGGSYSNGRPFIFENGKGKVSAGTFDYLPQAINASGDMVGVNTFYNGSSYVHYLFYTKRNNESVQLGSIENDAYRAPYITINDAGVIAVGTVDKLTFYQESTKINEVTGNDILFGEELFLLPNGNVLTKIHQLGTPRWARVTKEGSVSLIDSTFLPISARVDRVRVDGSVLIQVGSSTYIASLTSAPINVSLPSGVSGKNYEIVDVNSHGQYLLLDKRKRKGTLTTSEDRFLFAEGAKKPVSLTCMQSNRKKFHVNDAYSISESGNIFAEVVSRNGNSYSAALLVPAGSSKSPNFCSQISVKIVGACAKYFSDLEQKARIPGNKSCTAKVTVKDDFGKPITKAQIATISGGVPIQRGFTDSNGHLTFSFKTEGTNSYMEVVAPYRDAKFIGSTVELTFVYTY